MKLSEGCGWWGQSVYVWMVGPEYLCVEGGARVPMCCVIYRVLPAGLLTGHSIAHFMIQSHHNSFRILLLISNFTHCILITPPLPQPLLATPTFLPTQLFVFFF